MKVIHVITGLNDGGAEATLFKLCKYDQRNTHSVVALMGRGKYADQLEQLGVSVVVLDMPRGKIAIRPFFRLLRVIRKERPDVAQTWMYHCDLFGGLVARAAGVKAVVWNVRQSRLESPFAKKTTVWIAKLSAILSKTLPSRIIVCATEVAARHSDLGYQIEKIRHVPNGYALDHFRPDCMKRRSLRVCMGVSEETRVVGMVASFKPFKDHRNLLYALGGLKRRGLYFECWLAGVGMNGENQELKALIEECDLSEHVVLLDQQDDVAAFMNAIDLHILSSTTEGFPNVVAEAMACGTPCVVTEAGDGPHIVGDTGWVVSRHDHDGLANSVESALLEMDVAEAWRHRKERARARVEENYSIERMVEGYSAVWAEAKKEAAPR